MGAPDSAWEAGSREHELRIRGRTERDHAGTCMTTKMAAGKSAGNAEAMADSTFTPPAEVPITTMSCGPDIITGPTAIGCTFGRARFAGAGYVPSIWHWHPLTRRRLAAPSAITAHRGPRSSGRAFNSR